MIEREHAACPAEAGLDLVDAEERAVAAAKLLRPPEIAIGRKGRPVPLNGLDDENGYVFATKRRLEGVKIVERDA